MRRWLRSAVIVALAVGTAMAAAGGDGRTPPEGRRPGKKGAGGTERARPRFAGEVEVRERWEDLVGIAGSASEGTTGREQLSRRPLLRVGEIVETVPGLVATQHSGGGKANQYYLRGFNLDHGTDLAVRVGGVPVNMPSHGHGQGYADLNFVIPETIERVRYRKGPYFAEVGDFSAAGAVDVDLVDRLEAPLATVAVGGFGFRRAVAGTSVDAGRGTWTVVAEGFHYDGPWERPDDFRKGNLLVRRVVGDGGDGWSLTAMAYDGSWLATDQIPRRAVRSGLLDRFGLIDPDPRGDTVRASVALERHRADRVGLTSLLVYAVRYEFDLVSDFTYYLDDPVHGDEFEQEDRRWVAGVEVTRRWRGSLLGLPAESGVGLQVRHDAIRNALYHTESLARIGVIRRDAIRQWGSGAWAETWMRPAPRLRLGLGFRVDRFGAEVTAYRPENSGRASDWLASPKLQLAFRMYPSVEAYVDVGYGFHSNDARGATIRIDPRSGRPVRRVDPLVRAWGSEIGLRWHRGGLHATLSAFVLDLDSELLFVGDGGTTEASRPSRRVGLEWASHWELDRHVGVDLDATWTRARFTDDDPAGDRIPGAIEGTLAAGVSVREVGPFSGTLRIRAFSGGALSEDNSVRWGPTTLVDGRVEYRLRPGLALVAEGFNLLDSEDDDIAYYYVSRLPGEPPEGVADVHFHPMERRTFRVALLWRR